MAGPAAAELEPPLPDDEVSDDEAPDEGALDEEDDESPDDEPELPPPSPDDGLLSVLVVAELESPGFDDE